MSGFLIQYVLYFPDDLRRVREESRHFFLGDGHDGRVIGLLPYLLHLLDLEIHV